MDAKEHPLRVGCNYCFYAKTVVSYHRAHLEIDKHTAGAEDMIFSGLSGVCKYQPSLSFLLKKYISSTASIRASL